MSRYYHHIKGMELRLTVDKLFASSYQMPHPHSQSSRKENWVDRFIH